MDAAARQGVTSSAFSTEIERPLLLDETGPQLRGSHLRLNGFDTARWMFETVFDYGDGNYTGERR